MSGEDAGGRPPYHPIRELEEFLDICQGKRQRLFENAQRAERIRRSLHIGSGILALLSSLLASAIFTEILGGVVIKVITALAAFTSGVITLVSGTFANNKEIDEMFEGASRFLSLRDRMRVERLRPNLSPEQVRAAMPKLLDEYGKLSAKYDRYLGGELLAELWKGSPSKPEMKSPEIRKEG